MRGNLFISLIAGVAAYIAMLIVGVPFALPLAVAVAVLDLIPLVGATLGAIICVIVAGAAGGWLAALILAIYFIVYQQVENNLIQTTVYSRTVALSPLAVLVASLCGAAVAGIVGVLLAIPVAATVVVALVEVRALRTGTDARGLPRSPRQDRRGRAARGHRLSRARSAAAASAAVSWSRHTNHGRSSTSRQRPHDESRDGSPKNTRSAPRRRGTTNQGGSAPAETPQRGGQPRARILAAAPTPT